MDKQEPEDPMSEKTDDKDMCNVLSKLRTQMYWLLVVCCPSDFTVGDVKDIYEAMREKFMEKWREKESN